MLAEGNQIRKEADDTGPLTELEYWKQRTAKFSCLVDQIKKQPCRGVITTLVAAKSKIVKVRILKPEGIGYVNSCILAIFRPGVNWTLRSQMPPMSPGITSNTSTVWNICASLCMTMIPPACWTQFLL